ncbi:MAG TPA: bifunctional serine/threonine-protein kinase/formylglycine-generating enzyme family protein [Pyrinomonadaceae bacterium]|nr:bifunctional serine/threonine-protein kinase/formylglycine-generating enzyme family protein [Pyrinomonadaceae bacterium]
MLSPGTVLQNRYRIVRQLGQGGMGTVYEAVDERVSATVVVKEANEATDERERREFEREARLLANLQHKTLPKVMDYFIEGGVEYLVMEYVPGYDLAELLRRRGSPFHLKAVLRWADELLGVLDYLHGLKPPILHRDIKPSNLKLTQREEIYLLDFGLAKGAAGKMTMTQASRSVRGFTPVYAPLEQIAGQGTDPRSDIYAVGATLYHLLTGAPPVDAPTRDEQLEYENPDPLPPIRQLNPKVPEAVAEVIHRALSIKRKGRFENVSEMREALRLAEAEMNAAAADAVPGVPSENGPAGGDGSQAAAGRPTAYGRAGSTEELETARMPVAGGGVRATGPAAAGRSAVSPAANEGGQARAGEAAPARRRKLSPLVVGAVAALVVLALLVAFRGRIRRRLFGGGGSQPQATPAVQKSFQSFTENVNGVRLEMVAVPAGTFVMGTDDADPRRHGENEEPAHSVTVPNFYIGKYEVTQAQWRAVMGTDPSFFKGDDLPAERVNWKDAQEFCRKLSELTGREYRLPTEAEWEYACRAGTTGPFYAELDSIGWYGDNSGRERVDASELFKKRGENEYVELLLEEYGHRTRPVGQKPPNGFGLYDMHGNVAEACEDIYHDGYYGAPADGSAWLSGGNPGIRLQRGGSFLATALASRSAFRAKITTDVRHPTFGFRVAASAGK